MPVICVARGGSATAALHAARIILERAARRQAAYLICCEDRSLDPASVGGHLAAVGLFRGRSLLEEARLRRNDHDVLVIDASAASDHALAIAAALSDLILLPLHVEENDDASFIRNADLVDIVARNTRLHCRQMVFLATGAISLPTAAHLEIAGILMRRGLATLAAPLPNVSAAGRHHVAPDAADLHPIRDDFGECALKESVATDARSADCNNTKVA